MIINKIKFTNYHACHDFPLQTNLLQTNHQIIIPSCNISHNHCFNLRCFNSTIYLAVQVSTILSINVKLISTFLMVMTLLVEHVFTLLNRNILFCNCYAFIVLLQIVYCVQHVFISETSDPITIRNQLITTQQTAVENIVEDLGVSLIPATVLYFSP